MESRPGAVGKGLPVAATSRGRVCIADALRTGREMLRRFLPKSAAAEAGLRRLPAEVHAIGAELTSHRIE